MLCNTELINHSSYKVVLLLYCCIVRKCIALGPHLIYPGINYTLIKHLTTCLIKCKIISKALEHFCLESNTALSALKDLVHAYPVVCSYITNLDFCVFTKLTTFKLQASESYCISFCTIITFKTVLVLLDGQKGK